jgi:hypothetical protein
MAPALLHPKELPALATDPGASQSLSFGLLSLLNLLILSHIDH